MTLTVLPPPIVTPRYTQETLDLYTSKICRIVILRPNECGRKVVSMYQKYGDLSHSKLGRNPYIQLILNLRKESYTRKGRVGKDDFRPKKQTLYPGLPCHLCLELIPIDSKCVIKKGGNHTKAYHCHCARSVNVI